MDEGYAPAAMVALVVASLRRRGLPLPAEVPHDRPRVSIAAKRRLLTAVADAHGDGELLRAGQAAVDAPFDAIGHALTCAPSGHDCLTRWGRLERYLHSRHRTVITGDGQHGACVRHTARTGPAPVRLENLLVAGVLAGLLSAMGCRAVRLSDPGGAVLLDDGRPAGPVPAGPFDRFRLDWLPAAAAARAQPSLPHRPEPDRGPVMDAVIGRVLADPTRRWTVEDLAASAGMSGRTLQRRLLAEGATFSAAVATARLTTASVLLADTDMPPSAIGFLAGYADGPHFSREFSRRTGTSPGRYRAVITQSGTTHDLPL